MEYCQLGDLSMYIKKKPHAYWGGLSMNIVIDFVGQLCKGPVKREACAMSFLREFNLIHRDIKPQNVLLCPAGEDGIPVLKLADFGASTKVLSGDTSQGNSVIKGTPYFSPP